LQIPLVTGFIGGLNVEVHQLPGLEGLESALHLPPVVGIQVPGGSRHGDGFETAWTPNPLSRSTAEIMAPVMPYRSWRVGMAGAFPCPHNQTALAARLPASRRR